MKDINITYNQQVWLTEHGDRTVADVLLDDDNKMYVEFVGREHTLVREYLPI